MYYNTNKSTCIYNIYSYMPHHQHNQKNVKTYIFKFNANENIHLNIRATCSTYIFTFYNISFFILNCTKLKFTGH